MGIHTIFTTLLLLSLPACASGVLPGSAVQQKLPQPAGFSERRLGEFVQQSFGQAIGVLLGVGSGKLALEFFRSWPQGVIFMVDPYIHLRRGYEREENLDDIEHQRQYEH